MAIVHFQEEAILLFELIFQDTVCHGSKVVEYFYSSPFRGSRINRFSGLDAYCPHMDCAGCLDVSGTVPDQQAAFRRNTPLFHDLYQQSGFRLSTVALVLRPMRAEKYTVNCGLMCCQMARHLAVNGFEVRKCKQTATNTGLI